MSLWYSPYTYTYNPGEAWGFRPPTGRFDRKAAIAEAVARGDPSARCAICGKVYPVDIMRLSPQYWDRAKEMVCQDCADLPLPVLVLPPTPPPSASRACAAVLRRAEHRQLEKQARINQTLLKAQELAEAEALKKQKEEARYQKALLAHYRKGCTR